MMNKTSLKLMVILTGAMQVRKLADPKHVSVFSDHFAAVAVTKYPGILTEQDEIDISDAIWSCSGSSGNVLSIVWSFA